MGSDRIRRYDIDALRVIAIGLLLIYHTAIGFQGWGLMIGFITNDKTLISLWKVMAVFNIWRIPLLFFVSGMGVYFALKRRSWKQLFVDRGKRILLPFIFGVFFIVPIHLFLFQSYYGQKLIYSPGSGHLWFLGNICLYLLLLFPVFYYLKKYEERGLVQTLKKMLGSPWGLLFVLAIFMLEALCTKPSIFELYAMTWHGFFLGLIAFFFGFCFILAGSASWNMLLKWRFLFLSLALGLLITRFFAPQMKVHTLLLVLESNLWIFSVFAFGYNYLNRESKVLKILSPAVYPLYIVHMILLYLISYWIFPLNLDVWFKFFIVLLGTIIGSFLLYTLVIKRLKILKPLFGLL